MLPILDAADPSYSFPKHILSTPLLFENMRQTSNNISTGDVEGDRLSKDGRGAAAAEGGAATEGNTAAEGAAAATGENCVASRGGSAAEEGNRARCAYSSCTQLPFINVTLHSRQDISLTDEWVSILQKRVPEFRVAKALARPAIINDAVNRIERGLAEGANFDRERVLVVCARSVSCFSPHIFVARSPIPFQQV
jgi:hypothetical protein